ncbi:GroS Co-chaperonin GroES (HSP10) [uncultured Caudovirales phage]|uniref:GroS Co-chaperonin GroES (HSP10) n=1 Tax=uncultured Caudovirales phage TaxID=2100421 RepID=A0A6J5QTS2_9CAUD|nr:GroS Co-chaperonin GroES (HSP10) [uncultured Caudovirales phage]CAB4178243.1 GroS Co-chaperonin GroES (HSP10) [uncultured Caudovirales phage]CAB4187990.1 GroS Co-chaperonin GroES (HSP10) [uncultured Caudovirales phage]CAB4219383.1 GroS Co-chaperonin GroES (HSP10) [uncultured Caudovirales phage]
MIRPLHDNIVVKPDPFVQSGLIIMPEEDTRTGVVVATGPGKKDSKRPLMVSVGDHVMYSGTIDQTHDGLLIMKDKDVIGLV